MESQFSNLDVQPSINSNLEPFYVLNLNASFQVYLRLEVEKENIVGLISASPLCVFSSSSF